MWNWLNWPWRIVRGLWQWALEHQADVGIIGVIGTIIGVIVAVFVLIFPPYPDRLTKLPSEPQTDFRWNTAQGLGDWSGSDRTCSRGARPRDSECDERHKNDVAICWSDRGVGWPPDGDCGGSFSWCTYKTVKYTAEMPAKKDNHKEDYAPGVVYVCTDER